MNFGLITEGASEHKIIKHLVSRYFKDEMLIINQIQPKIVNDRQETTGGWNEVLKYCEREEINGALIENDYIIIQIDTDQSGTKPFSVSHTDSKGKLKSPEQLLDEVLQKLADLIMPEIRKKHEGKILFAVCIHTIECWLLPLFYDNKHKSDTSNCLSKLNAELIKKGIHGITNANKNKPNGIRSYDAILRGFKKKTDIITASKHNAGFRRFVDALGTV